MADNTRHHTVPKTYLDGFKDHAGFLEVFSKIQEKTFFQKPGEATVQRYYYSQPNHQTGERDNRIETVYLQKFEDDFPAFKSNLLNSPNNIDIEQLTNQLLVQRIRSPAFREAYEIGLAAMVRRRLSSMSKSKLPEPPKDQPNILDNIQISIDPHRSITAMARYAEKFGLVFWNLDYEVVELTRRQTALTSDNPVIWFEKSGRSNLMKIYPAQVTDRVRLYYPIDRNHYLIGYPKSNQLPSCRYSKRKLGQLQLRELQKRQFLFAWDKVIGKQKLAEKF